MKNTTRVAIFVAMVLFTIVSMWTTYKSLSDSILPAPTIGIPYGNGLVYECSVFALGLSVAIGLMLFALKLAIIDGHKRLNAGGLIGLTIIAFISISFNMDVLYRTANQDFFLRYTDSTMRSTYENYLAQVQGELEQRREALMKGVAEQEGELEAEIRGLRKKPAGYGNEAKHEDYELTLLQKTSEVELQGIDEAMAIKRKADDLLATTTPTTLDEVHQLQDKLRVAMTELAAKSNTPMPAPVRMETPFFAVFKKLFDFRTAGPMEFLILFLAFLLDLGDIIGYVMVPNKPAKPLRPAWAVAASSGEDLSGPEFVRTPAAKALPAVERKSAPEYIPSAGDRALATVASDSEGSAKRRRPFRMRRR